jgi:hypothetical protein
MGCGGSKEQTKQDTIDKKKEVVAEAVADGKVEQQTLDEDTARKIAAAKKEFLARFPTSDLCVDGLDAEQLKKAWTKYDKNGNGKLDKREVEKVAEDVVDMIPIMYRDLLKKANADWTDKQIDEEVDDNLCYLLPYQAQGKMTPGERPSFKRARVKLARSFQKKFDISKVCLVFLPSLVMCRFWHLLCSHTYKNSRLHPFIRAPGRRHHRSRVYDDLE